jgi:phosphoribosylformylglycinamidine cyclo-ligase
LLGKVKVHGIAHITGGGFDENIPRSLPTGCQAVINLSSFPRPPIFDYLQQLGNIPEREMYNIFNMGIGMIIIVDTTDALQALATLTEAGEEPYLIGEVKAGNNHEVILN